MSAIAWPIGHGRTGISMVGAEAMASMFVVWSTWEQHRSGDRRKWWIYRPDNGGLYSENSFREAHANFWISEIGERFVDWFLQREKVRA